MSWSSVIVVAIGLAMDAFAVSVATGLALQRVTHAHVIRMAFAFGAFQFFMPVLGWYAGRSIASHILELDHWVAFALLAAIGGKMLWEAWVDHPREFRSDPTVGWHLLTLSIATSIDALAVGLSMAVSLTPDIWTPSVVIGVVAAALTAFGLHFGARIGRGSTRWADLLGGVALIGVGTSILVEHLCGGA